jgi:RNA polymerase sigma-70 factor (ECF subfamily)
MDHPSALLIARWREGDQEAAEELFQRYAQRLLALARSRLPERFARHVDPEDVVQSAYRSFFTGARAGRYAFQRSGDLWRLLVAITMHKVQHQVERLTAGKRAVARERPLDADNSLLELDGGMLARGPTPAEAAALADTIERVFRDLEPLQVRIVELRLQGYSLEEIAVEVGRSERTVRRSLELIKARLQQEYQD